MVVWYYESKAASRSCSEAGWAAGWQGTVPYAVLATVLTDHRRLFAEIRATVDDRPAISSERAVMIHYGWVADDCRWSHHPLLMAHQSPITS